MKKCPYCGAEYPDDAVQCAADHTPLDQPLEPAAPPEPKHPEAGSKALSEEDNQKDFVLLARCGTLMEAELLASRLRAAGIEAFLPDETLMQVIGWNLNTFGYVRVQVAPRDYDAARELLGGNDEGEAP